MEILFYGIGLLLVIELVQSPLWWLGITLLLSGIGYIIWKYAYIKPES